jgi:adenosylhomocysteine nucleosidase
MSAPALIVGLAAEARIAAPLGWAVAVGGGGSAGADLVARRLVAEGAAALVSFGLAGGLDPRLRPGTLVVPVAVHVAGQDLRTDAALCQRLGGATAHRLLGTSTVAATAAAKRRLWQDSGAAAVDLESGAVAQVADAAGLPFAALRAICDPAERDLPPAALAALDQHGAIGLARVIRSVLRHPGQLPALLGLARDAATARRALLRRVAELRRAAAQA